VREHGKAAPGLRAGRAPAAVGQHAAQLLDLARLPLEHGRVGEHLVDGRVVDDALGAAGEAQRAVALIGVDERGRDGAYDGRLGVAAQRGLQDARQLAVAVRDVPAYAPRAPRQGVSAGRLLQAAGLPPHAVCGTNLPRERAVQGTASLSCMPESGMSYVCRNLWHERL